MTFDRSYKVFRRFRIYLHFVAWRHNHVIIRDERSRNYYRSDSKQQNRIIGVSISIATRNAAVVEILF